MSKADPGFFLIEQEGHSAQWVQAAAQTGQTARPVQGAQTGQPGGRTLLRLEGVSKRYGSRQVLRDLNFSLPAGRLIGLCGPNAAGKTTLLRLIAGFIPPSAGKIQRSETTISYVLRPEDFYRWMTVSDALEYYGDFHRDFDPVKARRLVSEARLSPGQKISRLSQGQKERLCLLLALSRRAQLYLLDESAAGIDPEFKRDFRRFLLANLPTGATALMATHLLKDFETLFDAILLLRNGQAEFYETDDIRDQRRQSIEQFYLEVTTHA